MNTEKHSWQVGDLCRAIYKEIGTGTVYRVIKVTERPQGSWHGYQTLTIMPLLGIFAGDKVRRKRELGSSWCHPLSLVDMGHEYLKLGEFIAAEAKRMGQDDGNQDIQEDRHQSEPDV